MSGATQEYRAKVQALRDALAAYTAEPGDSRRLLDPGEYPLAEAIIDAATEALDALDSAETDWSAEVAGLQDQRAALISERLAMQRERDAARLALSQLEVYAGHLVAPVEGCTCGTEGDPGHMPGCGLEPLAVMTEVPGATDWVLERVQGALAVLHNATPVGEFWPQRVQDPAAARLEYDPVRDGVPFCPTDRQHVLTQRGDGWWWCTGCADRVLPLFDRIDQPAPTDG